MLCFERFLSLLMHLLFFHFVHWDQNAETTWDQIWLNNQTTVPTELQEEVKRPGMLSLHVSCLLSAAYCGWNNSSQLPSLLFSLFIVPKREVYSTGSQLDQYFLFCWKKKGKRVGGTLTAFCMVCEWHTAKMAYHILLSLHKIHSYSPKQQFQPAISTALFVWSQMVVLGLSGKKRLT